MDIDFHYCATYVAARKAGFNPDEALVIARSAQMVDENARGVVDDKIVRMAGETGDYTATFETGNPFFEKDSIGQESNQPDVDNALQQNGFRLSSSLEILSPLNESTHFLQPRVCCLQTGVFHNRQRLVQEMQIHFRLLRFPYRAEALGCLFHK